MDIQQSSCVPILGDSLLWTVYKLPDVRLKEVNRLKDTCSTVSAHTYQYFDWRVPVSCRRT